MIPFRYALIFAASVSFFACSNSLTAQTSQDGSYFDKQTNEKWIPFQVPGTSFFVNLPGTPKHQDTTTRDGSHADEYVLQIGSRKFLVGCVTVPEAASIDQKLLIAAAEHAGNVYGTVYDSRPANNHGLSGGEATFTLKDGSGDGIVDYFKDSKHVAYFVITKPKPVVDRESAIFFVSVRSSEHWPPPSK